MEASDLLADIEKMNNLFIKMYEDPELYQEYVDDPRGVMAREEMSEEFIDIMLSKDIVRIRNLYAQVGEPTPKIIVHH